LKVEVYEESYTDFKTATQAIATAISIYNHFRPHSSTGHMTPRQLYTEKDTHLLRLEFCQIDKELKNILIVFDKRIND